MQPTSVEKILQGTEFYTGVFTCQWFKYFTSLSFWLHGFWRVLVAQLYLTLYDTMDVELLCPWDSPGKNTGAGSHSLLQGSFQNQGLKLGLGISCVGRWILYHQCRLGLKTLTTMTRWSSSSLSMFTKFFPRHRLWPSQILRKGVPLFPWEQACRPWTARFWHRSQWVTVTSEDCARWSFRVQTEPRRPLHKVLARPWFCALSVQEWLNERICRNMWSCQQ